MEKLNQTKGYVFMTGKVYGIDNKEPKKTEYKTSLNIRLNTTKDNSIFFTVGGWNNSPMSVKLKAQGMEQADEIPMGEVAEVLQDYFHDGDSVLVRATVDVNTYNDGRLDFIVNGIYTTKEEINFDSSDFEERNEVSIPAIISDKSNGEELKVKFVNYKGESIDQVLRAEAQPIKDFIKDLNKGDLIPVTFKVVNTPIYEEVKEDKPLTKSLMGKTQGGSQKRKIVGTDRCSILTDLLPDKLEKGKYKLDDEVSDDMPF